MSSWWCSSGWHNQPCKYISFIKSMQLIHSRFLSTAAERTEEWDLPIKSVIDVLSEKIAPSSAQRVFTWIIVCRSVILPNRLTVHLCSSVYCDSNPLVPTPTTTHWVVLVNMTVLCWYCWRVHLEYELITFSTCMGFTPNFFPIVTYQLQSDSSDSANLYFNFIKW